MKNMKTFPNMRRITFAITEAVFTGFIQIQNVMSIVSIAQMSFLILKNKRI